MRVFMLAFYMFLSASVFSAETAWQAEKTWVFAVGVISFDNKSLASWPDEGRVDAVMIEAYKKRGVPADRIVFIKNKDATRANLIAKFNETLAKTAEGDTLIFYYAGHGGRDYNDPKRTTSFVTYDTKSGWMVQEVFDAIEKHFKGSRVLLTADCCHSGALATEAPKRASHIDYGVLTSAHATSRSTGRWTFTQCLVDMLNGSPALDLNGDGKITFAEVGSYCEEEMSFCEGQLSCSAAKGHFATDLSMATTAAKKNPRVGEHCEGLDDGKWWKVKILDSKDGKYLVTWMGWDKKYDRWIDEKLLRPYKPAEFKTGTAVEVEYDKEWYAAKIKENKLGLQLVHYDGYPDIDDEWVAPDRIRMKK